MTHFLCSISLCRSYYDFCRWNVTVCVYILMFIDLLLRALQKLLFRSMIRDYDIAE